MSERRQLCGGCAAAALARRRFALVLFVLLTAITPRTASAQDLLIVPYLGFTFAGGSALFADLEQGSGETASAVGASAMLVGAGMFGVEADVGYVPGFFERGERQLVETGSFVTSLSGSLVLTLPLSVTRESLRPYVVAGGGLLRAEARDLVAEFPLRSTMPAVVLGGGAVGMLSSSVGVRFDLRYTRSLGQGDDEIAGVGPRVRFWRGGIGLVLRY